MQMEDTACIPQCRWEKNIKERQQFGYLGVSGSIALCCILRPYAQGGLDSYGLGYSLAVGFCEHSNENLDFAQGFIFLTLLRNS
jgi:hypothetical protein